MTEKPPARMASGVHLAAAQADQAVSAERLVVVVANPRGGDLVGRDVREQRRKRAVGAFGKGSRRELDVGAGELLLEQGRVAREKEDAPRERNRFLGPRAARHPAMLISTIADRRFQVSPQRITVVTTSFPASEDDAAGHFVRASARELEREGHRVTVVAPPPGGAFGWPGVAARLRARPQRAIEAATWVARARARVAREDADRVIAHWAVPCAWPIAVASRAPIDVVSHGGDVRLLAALPRPARERVATTIARRATTWSFVSDALLGEWLAGLRGSTRRLVEAIAVVQPPPLDLPDAGALHEAIARRRRSLAGERVAVTVGRLVPTKRVDLAIEHVALRPDVDALIVVGDGPEQQRLERLARSRGVAVRFVGAVGRRDALAWIGAARLLVHASEVEGLSTVVREAEALGTPVVRLQGRDARG